MGGLGCLVRSTVVLDRRQLLCCILFPVLGHKVLVHHVVLIASDLSSVG